MNIRISDSWLREHLKTKADHKEIAKIMSLTSVSVERIEKIDGDYIYDIEVTTNRPDLMSVVGLAREAATALSENGIEAKFIPFSSKELPKSTQKFPIEIVNDPKLVNRICAVVMDVKIGQSPKIIKDRLEASGIRSLNNLIDVTNYVMRETGHPTHVFDLDRLNTKRLTIRRSEKGEVVETLDQKNYTLLGDDIVAIDDNGRIVDLLGVMGTSNSVVSEQTKRILFFVDNNNPVNIRNTSMNLGIRTEAAVINEKGIDPNLSMTTLLEGIELYQQIAEGKVASEVLDIYPNKVSEKNIKVSFQKINEVIGIEIPEKKSIEILKSLGFETEKTEEKLLVAVPTIRGNDIEIEEDIIEEIARIYGYHNLPSVIPTFFNNKPYSFANIFYFENRIKNAMKYLGFTEVYTYSLISEDLYEGPIENAIKLKNPLSEDMAYLRSTLVPSLISVVEENKKEDRIKIFEISNTYHKKSSDLPVEKMTLAGVIKKQNVSFFEAKGLIEAVFEDIGVKNLKFKEREEGLGSDVFKNEKKLGYIEVLDNQIVDFEFDLDSVLSFANLKKIFKPLAKFPPIIEDMSIEISDNTTTQEIISEIKSQSDLIVEVSLMDEFGAKKTFHIIYQDPQRNLTGSEISKIREKITKNLQEKFNSSIK